MILFFKNFAKTNLVESISNPLSDMNNISNITDNSKKLIKNQKGNIHIQIKNNWHTDGYYYPTNFLLNLAMHCENQAESGGKII